MAKSTLSVERLRELLDYDPATGVFHRRIEAGHSHPGEVAGTMTKYGYLRIRIDSADWQAHRLAWLYVHGVWPAGELDHRNENKADNRIGNLRDATDAENKQNIYDGHSDNAAGYRGVSLCRGRWRARIMIDGRERYVGSFDKPEEARDAYLAAKRELHSFWADR